MKFNKNNSGQKFGKLLTGFLFLLSAGGGIFPVKSQISEKLPATTIIGTEISIDYEDNSPSTTLNTIADAFDDDLETYFSSYEKGGTWVGLDLGEAHIITKIAYSPHIFFEEGPELLLLGIFEGANEPDFLDAVPLFMITEPAQTDSMTEQDIDCSKGFRYVRYIGPPGAHCLIAEIAFYGYPGAGDNSLFPQITNLPTLTIHTDDNEEITSRDYYVNGYISIICDDGKSFFEDGLGIRGRGHGSWVFPKKSFRIKLFNKVNLLGFPAKERNWTLISNYGDKTLMRNLLAFDLSKRFEMTYTSVGIPVDVVLNGEYHGTYNLCDQLEVARGRVDVQEMSPDDNMPPEVTGGYLIEVDAYAPDEDVWFESAFKHTPVRIRYPKGDEITVGQYAYIRDHYNKMEDAVFAADFRDPVNGFRKYVDPESFIRHFLVGEISGNTDTYWSVYMYKERDEDVFRFGPVWDFDLAYENDRRTYPINEHTQWVFHHGSSAPGFHNLVDQLLVDEALFNRVKEVYAGYRCSGMITKEALLQVVDDYALELDRSQQLNFMRWKILNSLVHLNPVVFGSYEEEVNNVKRYISERIDWMDRKLDYLSSGNEPFFPGFSNIRVYVKGNTICIQSVSEPVHCSVVDMTGRVLFSKSVSNNVSVPVSKGLYFIMITDAGGNMKVAKCFVNY